MVPALLPTTTGQLFSKLAYPYQITAEWKRVTSISHITFTDVLNQIRRQPAWFHQGKILPDQTSGLL